MPLTDVEYEIVRTVVRRFLNMKEPTPRILLLKRFKDPDALDHLSRSVILRADSGERFLPRALAFECCGDADALRLAKASVELVIRVLQNLFDAPGDKIDFTLAEVEEHARKMYDVINPETIKLGIYLAQEFSGILAGIGGDPPNNITFVRINERIVLFKNIESVWDEHIQQYNLYLGREGVSEIANPTERAKPDTGNSTSSANQDIVVLISHSSKDKVLAEALIELLRSGLGLLASQIRCTSVDGYRLPAGVNTDAQLRKEIKSTKVLIGLLTPNSISSTYVLFELGARWGLELFMIPLLAGIEPEQMRGPHGVLNALSCESQSQLIQLVEDTGKELNITPQSASSYLKQVGTVKALAESITASSGTHNAVRSQRVAAPASLAKPNIIFLNSSTVRLRRGAYEGEGFYESDDPNDPFGAIACFRNEPSSTRRVIDANDVRAQIIYRDSKGEEVGNGVPRACWVGYKFDLINFPLGQSNCAILMMAFNDGRLFVPWKERARSSDSWMGGDTITTRHYQFSKDSVTTVEIRLISDENQLLLPPLTFDFSLVDGQPNATIKQQ